MRKWIRIIPPFAAVAASAAFLVPAGHAQLPICPPGTTNTLYCQLAGPTIIVNNLSPSCHRTSPVHVRGTITAPAGIRRVRITLDGRTIRRQSSGRIRLTVGTKNLKPGVHTIRIVATDKSGKVKTRTLHFRVCTPRTKAVFTG